MLLVCPQGGGENKAEAVATVVAAVDLARVRVPAPREGARTEEEQVEVRIEQQAAAEKHVTLPAEPPVAAQQLRVSQVGRLL